MSLEMLSGGQVGGASLNLLKGEEHLRLKKALGDAFSEEAVEALAPVLQECTQLFCKRCADSAHLQEAGFLWDVPMQQACPFRMLLSHCLQSKSCCRRHAFCTALKSIKGAASSQSAI